MPDWLLPAWNGWKRIARRVADFQGRALLTVLYLVLVTPVGLVLRLVADPLRRIGALQVQIKLPPGRSWTPEDRKRLENAAHQ